MRNKLWMVLAAIALIGGAGAVGWWLYDRVRGTGLPDGIIIASGRVEGQDVRVSAATGGRIVRLAVAEGERVRAGQLIAQLDQRTTAAVAGSAQAGASAAEENVAASSRRISALESQLALAKIEAERYRRLFERGASPRQAADRADAALSQLQNEVSAARAARELALHQVHAAREQTRAAAVQLDETTVIAPIDGVVEDELVREGEMMSPGMPIILLRRSDLITVKVYLPIAQAQQVQAGTEARAYVEGVSDRFFPGTVERVASQAEFTPKDVHMPDDRTTLVFAVEIRFPNGDAVMKDGFPVDVYLRTRPSAPWPSRPPWR